MQAHVTHAGGPAESRPTPDHLAFLALVLRDVNQDARLVSVVAAPPGHYTVRIARPNVEAEAMLILSQVLVDNAPGNEHARRSVRAFLASAAGTTEPRGPVADETTTQRP